MSDESTEQGAVRAPHEHTCPWCRRTFGGCTRADHVPYPAEPDLGNREAQHWKLFRARATPRRDRVERFQLCMECQATLELRHRLSAKELDSSLRLYADLLHALGHSAIDILVAFMDHRDKDYEWAIWGDDEEQLGREVRETAVLKYRELRRSGMNHRAAAVLALRAQTEFIAAYPEQFREVLTRYAIKSVVDALGVESYGALRKAASDFGTHLKNDAAFRKDLEEQARGLILDGVEFHSGVNGDERARLIRYELNEVRYEPERP